MARCAFCNQEILKGTSPEHVIPKWMNKFRPKGKVLRHTTKPEMRGDVEYPRPTDAPDHNSNTFDLTADTVCESCNHGWMSDLETHGSPLLTPMIEGKTQGLTVEQQWLLGQWIAKTALTWDQSNKPARRLFPLRFHHWLYKHRLPPPGATIQLGRYEGAGELVEMVYDAMYLEVPADPVNPGPPQAHRATIRVDQLVMELTITEDAKPRVAIWGGDIADMLITIWPSVTVTSWPPSLSFDRHALDAFIDPDRLSRPR
jgi:hypothetical protein